MKYKIAYYRTLIYESEIDADTFDEAKRKAEREVSAMLDTDFDQIHEEVIEIEHDNTQIPETIVTLC